MRKKAIGIAVCGLVLVLGGAGAAGWFLRGSGEPSFSPRDHAADYRALFEAHGGNAAGPNGWDALLTAGQELDRALVSFLETSGGTRAWLETQIEPRDASVFTLALEETRQDALAATAEVRAFLVGLDGSPFQAAVEEVRTSRRVAPPEDAALDRFSPSMRRASSIALDAGRACAGRMRVAFDEGDHRACVLWFERGLAIARAAGHGHVIARIGASGAESVTTAQTHRLVASGRCDDATLLAVADALERQHAAPPVVTIELERLSALREVEATTKARSANRAIVERIFDAWVQLRSGDEEARREGRASVEDLMKTLESSERYAAAQAVVPAVVGRDDMFATTEMRRDALRAAIALERHRLRTGAYPETLDALVPELLPGLPRDRFAAGGAAPLRYLRVDPAQDPLGRGYLIYTVGKDGADNGGRLQLVSRGREWGRPGHTDGTDLVFNDWREP